MNKAYSRINWQNEPSIATPINDVNLNRMDNALDTVDTRVVNFDTTKANETDVLQCFNSITYDSTTGVFVFTKKNGTSVTADLNIEKIPVSFSMDANGIITMTTADGTQYTADVSTLIKDYTFTDSSTIDFTVTPDTSGNKTITATVIDGSIDATKLEPNYLADCQAAKNDAQLAASAASGSETAAASSAEDSQAWATGMRGSSAVPSTDPAYENNAYYWAQEAAHYVGAAVITQVQWDAIEDLI